jgi:hypothetical protein
MFKTPSHSATGVPIQDASRIGGKAGNGWIVPLIPAETKLIAKFPKKFKKQTGGVHV